MVGAGTLRGGFSVAETAGDPAAAWNGPGESTGHGPCFVIRFCAVRILSFCLSFPAGLFFGLLAGFLFLTLYLTLHGLDIGLLGTDILIEVIYLTLLTCNLALST